MYGKIQHGGLNRVNKVVGGGVIMRLFMRREKYKKAEAA
jgi:hypothetical protein